MTRRTRVMYAIPEWNEDRPDWLVKLIQEKRADDSAIADGIRQHSQKETEKRDEPEATAEL